MAAKRPGKREFRAAAAAADNARRATDALRYVRPSDPGYAQSHVAAMQANVKAALAARSFGNEAAAAEYAAAAVAASRNARDDLAVEFAMRELHPESYPSPSPGGSSGALALPGDEGAIVVFTPPTKAGARTLLGVARVRVEEQEYDRVRVRVLKLSINGDGKPPARVGDELVVRRAELYVQRIPSEEKAFRAEVNRLWGRGTRRGEERAPSRARAPAPPPAPPLPVVPKVSAAEVRAACRSKVGRAAARARVACEHKERSGEEKNPSGVREQSNPRPARYMTPKACRTCGARTSALAKYTAGGSLDETGPVFYDASGKSGSFGGLAVRCSGCGEPRAVKAVHGVVNRAIACDARCESSHGFKCECSCGGKNHGASFSSAPAARSNPRPRVLVPNPTGSLSELGLLTRLTYRDGRGELVELVWALKDAPILAHDDASRLFVVYQGKVTRAASPPEIERYERMHWGARARGKVRSGVFATAPFRRLGTGETIVYTTIKGGDGSKRVDYRHEWGDGARGRFVAPSVYVHRCGSRACMVENAIALGGGSYTVETHGIIG